MMDAFGFDNPSYGGTGLDALLKQWFAKEQDPAMDPYGVPGDAYGPAGEYYQEQQKEDRLKKLFSNIDPQYLKNLGNAGASGQAGMSMPAPGTPNIPTILDAVPMEYLIPLLGMTGVLEQQKG